MLRFKPEANFSPKELAELWFHENLRVYQDRMSSQQDKLRFAEKCAQIGSSLILKNDKLENRPIVFADFVEGNSYKSVSSIKALIKSTKTFAEGYAKVSKDSNDYYVSQELAENVTRVVKSLNNCQGNALLLGTAGSGRHTVARLAAHIAGLELRQIQMTNSYSIGEWHCELKSLLIAAGSSNKSLAVLLSDSQLKEAMVEDIDHILMTGNVPFLFDSEDINSEFCGRVKKNLHFIFCMNPYEDSFSKYIETYPSLLSKCSVNWFCELSAETLAGIASNHLTGSGPA